MLIATQTEQSAGIGRKQPMTDYSVCATIMFACEFSHADILSPLRASCKLQKVDNVFMMKSSKKGLPVR